MSAPWGSVRPWWWCDGLITHHMWSHLPPSVSQCLPVSPHSCQILPGLHYSSWHVITWSVWGSHETWDTLSKLFPVHKIYDPKVAPIIYQIVSGSPFPISLWQISWEFLWRNPPPRFFSSCVSNVLLQFLLLSHQMTTYRDQVTRTKWFTWCAQAAHCLTLTNFPCSPCSLDPPWQTSWLAVPVSPSTPRGAGLSSLPGAPSDQWASDHQQPGGKNNNDRKFSFPCLSNLWEDIQSF